MELEVCRKFPLLIYVSHLKYVFLFQIISFFIIMYSWLFKLPFVISSYKNVTYWLLPPWRRDASFCLLLKKRLSWLFNFIINKEYKNAASNIVSYTLNELTLNLLSRLYFFRIASAWEDRLGDITGNFLFHFWDIWCHTQTSPRRA